MKKIYMSIDLPIINVPGYYNQNDNASLNVTDFEKYDNYIMALNKHEQPVWATFYGGEYPSNTYSADNNSYDRITDLSLSGSQYLYLTGETRCKYSPYNQCPSGAAYCDQTYNPGSDVFIARMNIGDLPTGISDIKTNKTENLTVFPNPSINLLNLIYKNSKSGNQSTSLEITDLSGRVVWTGSLNLKHGDNIFTLNIKGLSSGMYFLEINNQGSKSSVKFIKR